MSDTPRTDAEELEAHIGVQLLGHKEVCNAYRFAKKLERELNAANERIKRLESVEKSHAEVLKSIDEWMKRFKAKEAKP